MVRGAQSTWAKSSLRAIIVKSLFFFLNLYLESQFVHNMFQGMLRSQFLHVSSQLVASKAVRAGHHKLIASHSLKSPESCHLSKGVATKEQNKGHLGHISTSV